MPAPTADLNSDIKEETVNVPFYENVVCSMQYKKGTVNEDGSLVNDGTANVTPYPADKQDMNLMTRQSCGIIPVYKWNSGTYEEVA